jgi:hypothetical protein
LPRIEATISCTASSKVDLNNIQKAVAELVKSITGESCQVILNTTSTSGISERVRAYQIKQDLSSGNIGIRP